MKLRRSITVTTEGINIMIKALENDRNNYHVIGVMYENATYVALVQAIESLQKLRGIIYPLGSGKNILKI